MRTDERPLDGKTIAVPETRELDLMASMLEGKGARVLRCPLVAIHDAPDPKPVEKWIDELIREAFADVVFYTGEGIRRLATFADRFHKREAFIGALRAVRKITRGPKPVKALHELGLDTDVRASAPTTAGIIETLLSMDMKGRAIGVVFYSPDFNEDLMKYLRGEGATVYGVAPYVYADKSEDERVRELLRQIDGGKVDLIAFTSKSQVDRLVDFMKSSKAGASLADVLKRTQVAAVGPVVGSALEDLGVTVRAMPEKSFFLRPMVNEIVAVLGNH